MRSPDTVQITEPVTHMELAIANAIVMHALGIRADLDELTLRLTSATRRGEARANWDTALASMMVNGPATLGRNGFRGIDRVVFELTEAP